MFLFLSPRHARLSRQIPSCKRTRLSCEWLESRRLLASVPLAPLTVDDQFATNEDSAVVGNVLAGAGADTAPQAVEHLRVAEVNGRPLSGAPIKLSTGATLDIGNDGSFTYDPRMSLGLQALATGQQITEEFTSRCSTSS